MTTTCRTRWQSYVKVNLSPPLPLREKEVVVGCPLKNSLTKKVLFWKWTVDGTPWNTMRDSPKPLRIPIMSLEKKNGTRGEGQKKITSWAVLEGSAPHPSPPRSRTEVNLVTTYIIAVVYTIQVFSKGPCLFLNKKSQDINYHKSHWGTHFLTKNQVFLGLTKLSKNKMKWKFKWYQIMVLYQPLITMQLIPCFITDDHIRIANLLKRTLFIENLQRSRLLSRKISRGGYNQIFALHFSGCSNYCPD